MTHRAHDLETLLAYADGALGPAKAGEVEAHLATHADDAQIVAQYRLIKQRIGSDDSVEPSAAALARARAIFNPSALPKRETTGWLTAVDRFIARCIFDSRLEPISVRSAGAEQLVNLSFEAPDADIDIQAERIESFNGAEPRWHILGQINTSASAAGLQIALTPSGSIAPVQECTADEHGTFNFQSAPGRYDLHIRLATRVVVLPDITMR